MTKIILLVLLLLVVGALFCREVLEVGTARRAGEDLKAVFMRFRRRTKGLILLVGLYLLAAYYEEVAKLGLFNVRAVILYIGLTLIVLIWLLILAARDFHEAATAAVRENQKLTLEVMDGMEERIRRETAVQTCAQTEGAQPPDTPDDTPARRRRRGN